MYTTYNIQVFFGLTEKELQVYRYLLRNPKSNAADIAKGIGMQRPNTYDLLHTLLSKGLVSYTATAKVKFYTAVHPSKLKEIYEFQKEEIASKEKDINTFVSSLVQTMNSSPSELNIKTYTGLKGMRTVLLEAIEQSKRTKQEMLAIRLNTENLPKLDETYTKRFFTLRRKFHLKSRYLALKNTILFKDPLVTTRILPNTFSSPLGLYLYANTVTFWFFPKKEIILAIENKEYAESFRQYFEIMWLQAKKS